jgi:hypothetical protein
MRRKVSAAALLLVLVAPLLSVPSVSAQDTEDASIGVIVRWTTPFEERTDLRAVPDASHETILSHEDDYLVVANGGFTEPADARLAALEALGADPATLLSVDVGMTGDLQYWLDLVTVEDTPYGAFTLARTIDSGVTLTLFMGPVASFADGMAQAQQVVFVDEEPLFDGVEPTGLQAFLDAELPALETGGAADEDGPEDAAATEAAQDETESAPNEPGLVGEGSYRSPHHGFALTWTDSWMLDPAFEEPVTSDVNFDEDQVYLTVNSPQWVWFTLTAVDTQGLSLAEIMGAVTTPLYLAQVYGETAELVVSRTGINADGDEVGALIIRVTTLEGYNLLAYEEWRLADDGTSVAGLHLLMLVDDMEPGLRATDHLAFEGGPVITLFTHDEILGVAEETDLL